MSKTPNKVKLKHRDNTNHDTSKTTAKNKQTNNTVYIGHSNVKLWSELKIACKFDCDVEFTNFLLKLAQQHVRKQTEENEERSNDDSPKPDEFIRRSIRQAEQNSNDDRKENRRKHKMSHHRSEKSHSKHKKDCDNKKEKSKNKRKASLDAIASLIDENVHVTKQSPKIDIDYQLPMVVVEKMDFTITNMSKSSDVFNNDDTNEESNKRTADVNNLIDNKIDNVINQSTKIDMTQDVDNLVMNSVDREARLVENDKKNKKLKLDDNVIDVKVENDVKKHHKHEKIKRKIKHHDIRKAPELDIKLDIKTEITSQTSNVENVPLPEPQPESQFNENVQERVAIKIKLCASCNTRHLQDACPLRNPFCIVQDAVAFEDFQKTNPIVETVENNNKNHVEIDLQISMDSEDKSIDSSINRKELQSFSVKSLPEMLYLDETNSTHGLSVFTKCEIKEYTQFGPIIGKAIKEVDIPEDFGMKHLWEIYAEKNIYINTEDVNNSNWLRYIRPAPSRELRNVAAVSKAEHLYVVTTRNIVDGEELLYWQDDALGTNKKKMEKTNCGGCNLSFSHPLYYRMHCSVFHDIRYSLTIRKYHCKVCGLAVLGKDNIMKHAVEMHNGQGAYQCQFCKKFFLRLNYLEMHRTYGCAANPHRSRPLCDFCGRKFCQPQKLKVHIKRMHSDMTEVLREFQCKNCMKLLGSRAALQRHVKEVHQKQVEGACTCIRCGKLFQNKSNLKIHMLTHSGVKPFKCKEENCNAAFTTKQCLQFHYKKVHGFAEDIMPKIERSVEYTFAAYAGVKDTETEVLLNPCKKNKEGKLSDNLMCLEESTDVDDISLDGKNLDEPPALHSPTPITSEHSSESDQAPPMLEAFSSNRSGKVLSKGSKKWLGEQLTPAISLPLAQTQKEIYSFEKDVQKSQEANMILEVEETQSNFDRNKLNLNLNMYNRHESSNASLLVEAALDSVSDIQITNTETNIDVNGSQSCTDSLVNNLYSLSHQDNLPDVTYNHNEDLNESRDINLISPSVNDHISVTDHDLNDDIPNRTLSLDYSSLHHGEFSPSSSPNLPTRSQLIHDYNIHGSSPSHTPRSRLDYTLGQDSEIVSPGNSPPRYDFHQNTTDNLSSDESNNGIVAQNLSLNSTKDKLRLDLVGYKSHYNELDTADMTLRKYETFRPKYDLDNERNKLYDLALDERTKNYNDGLNSDIRNKFDIANNAECNNKTYSDNLETEMRTKQYDNIEQVEMKIKQFDIENDFRLRSNKYDQINSKYDDDLHGKQIEIDVDLRSKNFNGLDADRDKNIYDNNLETEIRNKSYDVVDSLELRNKNYDNIVDSDFRTDRNFEPLVLNSTELQGLDMSARGYHNFHSSAGVQSINRYHHIYSELERPTVDLRLGYSPPPPPPPYTHADVLRVVSLDLTPPGRHSVDLSLRSHSLHPHQLTNSRLLPDHPLQANRLISADHNLSTNRLLTEHNRLTLDQSRLLTSEHNLTSNRLLASDRLMSDSTNRLISDHTTNRLLSNDQVANRLLTSDQGRVISDETRLLSEQSRLLDQRGLLSETRILQPTPANTPSLDLVTARGGLSPAYTGYSVSPSPYHASTLAARSHGSSPGHTATGYHHYSTYY